MPSIHAGHRKRVKEEFLARGLEGMADHRVLELLLFFAIPQGDVNPLAHELLNHFGSLSAVFQATYEQLLEVKGVGSNTAALIRFIPAVGGRYLADRTDLSRRMTESWQFKELLEPCFFASRNEEVYLVCLDSGRKLLSCRKLGEGIVDQAAVTSRKVMEAALACNASYAVLAHNHVNGTAMPSAADLATTRRLKELLAQVDIVLLDHFIFGDGDMVSLRESHVLD